MSNCILPNIFQHIKLMHLRWLTYICTYVFALAPQLCTGARSPRTISKSVCTNGVHIVLRSARLCNCIDFMCVFALIRDLYAFHLLWFFFFFLYLLLFFMHFFAFTFTHLFFLFFHHLRKFTRQCNISCTPRSAGRSLGENPYNSNDKHLCK